MISDLALVRRFEAVCRLRSFSRAAEELGLSHSAMTKSIRTLENDLNLRLIDRTTRTLTPTEAGQRFLLLAPDLLAHADDVRAAVVAETLRLNIICGPFILDALGHRALRAFRARHPEVHVDLQSMTAALATEQLTHRRADLLLVHRNVARQLPHRKTLAIKEIVSEPYAVLFRRGHPATGSEFSLSTLLRFDWVVAGFDSLFQNTLPPSQLAMLRRNGFPKYRISSLSACADMVEDTDLLTLAPASAVTNLIADRALASAPLPSPALFSICAVARADAIEAAHVRSFIAAVGAACGRTPRGRKTKAPA